VGAAAAAAVLLLHGAPTWCTAQLNDVQLGDDLPVLQRLLSKGDDRARGVTASKLQNTQ
jgi:hypothetical protein